MPTINVVNLIPTTDGFLTRSVTNDSEIESDVYKYPIEQDYIKFTNQGDNDIFLGLAGYENTVVHGRGVFETRANFKEFTVRASKGSIQFTAVTKEYNDTPLNQNDLWQLMETRDKTESGDMILVAANATTSAGAINAAIAGVDKKYDRTVDIKLTNTAGTTHEWFYGMFNVAVTKVSVDGIATISQTVVPLNAGVGTVVITHTGTWAENDTITLTITGGKQFGYPISNDTSVDTLGA